MSRLRSLAMAFSQTSGFWPVLFRSRVSIARLPAQSSALWHFSQRLLTMLVNTLLALLAPASTGVDCCVVSSARASEPSGTQAPASISTHLNHVPLLRIPSSCLLDPKTILCGRATAPHQCNGG